jgi:hypothetical protein
MDRAHLERAAVSYAQLRGLLLVPLGLLFGLAALANWNVLPDVGLAAGAVLIGLVCLRINRHYRRHYGRVRQSPRQRRRDALAMVLAFTLVIAASVALRDLPVNAIAIAFAIAMGAGYALGSGLRAHHVAIFGALLVAGAIPVWDDDAANVGLLLAGVAVAVTGVFDHRAFLHTFGPAADAGA